MRGSIGAEGGVPACPAASCRRGAGLPQDGQNLPSGGISPPHLMQYKKLPPAGDQSRANKDMELPAEARAMA